MTNLRVTAALFVDLGEGRETKTGPRAGEIRWDRLPRARYECLRCQTAEYPDGHGPGDIARFIATIRTTHVCQAKAPPEAA